MTEMARLPLEDWPHWIKIQWVWCSVGVGTLVGLLYIGVSVAQLSEAAIAIDHLGENASLLQHNERLRNVVLVAVLLLFVPACAAVALRCWNHPSRPIQALGKASGVILSIGAFMVVGPALMLLNKHIMQELLFDCPLTLSSLGLCTSAICVRFAVACGAASVRPETLTVVAGRDWYLKALPIGACKAITLATGNASYLYLGLGFMQMLKAFTPAIVLFVMRLANMASPTRATIFFVWIIVVGTLLEVKGELHATPYGLFLMFTSEVAEAANLVLTQKILQSYKFSVVEGLYVLAPPGCTCLVGAAAVLEWPRMLREGHFQIVKDHAPLFLWSSFLGLAVVVVGLLVLQATSSLTVKILNTFRCVMLVFVGVLVYGEYISRLEIIGYSVALFGFAGYNYVQVCPENGSHLERWFAMTCRQLLPVSRGTRSSLIAIPQEV